MVKKKKQKEEELAEGDFLDEPEDVEEEESEDLEEEIVHDPLGELHELVLAQSASISKLTKAVVQNQKYITIHAKELHRLRDDFKLLLEEK